MEKPLAITSTDAAAGTTPAAAASVVDETVEIIKKKSRKISVSAIYQGTQPGKKPSREILNNVTQFRRKHAGKTIDVWWM